MDKSKLKQIHDYLKDLEKNLEDKLDEYTYQDIISISQDHLPKLDQISDDLATVMDEVEDWNENKQYTDLIFLLHGKTHKCEQAIEDRMNKLIQARICELLDDDNIQTPDDLWKAIKEILTYQDFLSKVVGRARAWWSPAFLKAQFPGDKTIGDEVYDMVYEKAWDLKLKNSYLDDPPDKVESDYVNGLQRIAGWCIDKPEGI